jgi:hypothetical protein
VCLVDDKNGRKVSLSCALEDLKKEGVLAAFGGFSQLGHNEAEQGARADSREMKIDGAKAVFGEVLDEEPQQSRFSDTGLAHHEGKCSLPGEILEPGQGLREAWVVEYPL